MRFLPLFDKKVDMFVSVNSRLSVTPLMKHIIDYWENAEDKQKKLLTLTYQTSASRANMVLLDNVYTITYYWIS